MAQESTTTNRAKSTWARGNTRTHTRVHLEAYTARLAIIPVRVNYKKEREREREDKREHLKAAGQLRQ